MIVAIGGEFFTLEIVRAFANRNQILFCIIQHRLEVFMILTGESLRGKNHLMFGINQRLRVVSLQDPVRGGHLRGFIIHRVALDLLASVADLGFAIL